jgi:hypothetical protein
LAPTVAICAKTPAPVFLSILNPVSLFELSVQDRLICVAETGVAERPEGVVTDERAGAEVVKLALAGAQAEPAELLA